MKSRSTINVFIFSIILFFLSVGVTAYVFTAIDQKGDKLMVDLKALKDHYFLKTEYDKLRAELDDSASDRERLQGLVLDGEDGAVELLSLVDQLAKDLDLKLTTKELSEEVTKTAGFDDLYIEFGISGDTRSVLNMVQLFELLPYHSKVVSLSAARKFVPETNTTVMDASIGLRISIREN